MQINVYKKEIIVDEIRYLLKTMEFDGGGVFDKRAIVVELMNPTKDCVVIEDVIEEHPVREIKPQVFAQSNISKILIPDSIQCIGFHAFLKCTELKKIETYHSKSYTAPQMFLEPEAFYGCVNLKTVRLETLVKEVGILCFSNCENLTQLDIEVRNIAGYAFKNCVNLKEICFTNEAFFVGTSFNGCKNLKTITFKGKLSKQISKTALKILNTKTIKCTPSFNHMDLMYTGAKIEVLSS